MFISSMHLSSVRVREALIRYYSKEDYSCLYNCNSTELSEYARTFILLARMSRPSLLSSLAFNNKHSLKYYTDSYVEVKNKSLPEFGGFKLNHQVSHGGVSEAVNHLRTFVNDTNTDVRKKRHLYLCGPANMGKTAFAYGTLSIEDQQHRMFVPSNSSDFF